MKTILIPAGQWLSEDVISQEDAERIISRWGSYEDYEQRQADIEAQQKAKASGTQHKMKGISHVEIVTNSRSEIEAAANKWRKALGMPGCVQLSAAETIAAERERKAGIRRQLEKEMAEHVSEGELSAEQRREREQHRAGAAWARACSDGKVLKKTGARLLVWRAALRIGGSRGSVSVSNCEASVSAC